jgi:D-sedoheptulose 7-phosphate isomerase
MSLANRIQQQFKDSAQTKEAALPAMAAPIEAATRRMATSLRAGGKVMACGNGGSAADSQHFAAELLNRFEKERPPLAAIALTTDTSTLTSIANDYRYEDVFAKQVRRWASPATCCWRFRPRGNSPNVIEAIRAAHERGIAWSRSPASSGGEMAACSVPTTFTCACRRAHRAHPGSPPAHHPLPVRRHRRIDTGRNSMNQRTDTATKIARLAALRPQRTDPRRLLRRRRGRRRRRCAVAGGPRRNSETYVSDEAWSFAPATASAKNTATRCMSTPPATTA